MLKSDKNRIEEIKRHLYDPEDTTSKRSREGVLHPVNHKVAEAWAIPETVPEDTTTLMKRSSTSHFKKFFLGAVIFFLAALGFAIYMYMHGSVSVSNENIDVTVLGNAFAKGGEELPLQVEITNRNNASLELSNLIIEYPRGANDAPTDMIRLPRESIGTIKKGETITRNIKVTLYGDEKSTRTIKISLEYHPEGSNAIFTREKEYQVTISSAPLSLLVDAPSTATSDQVIAFKVTAVLNTALPQGSTMLQIAYPSNFIYDSALPAPAVGTTVWDLSTLAQGKPLSIIVKGRFVGQEGDQQVFHVYAGTTSATDKSKIDVVYNSLLQTVTITKPFLEAHILVDNQDQVMYTVTGNDTVHAQIAWANNLSTRITDAQIIVNFSGNAFDKSTVDALEGFYDSEHSRIIWDKNTIPDLGSVEPGARGTVGFTFKPLSLLGSATVIRDPQIALDVSIRGSQPSQGATFTNVDNFSKKIIKIVSDFQIASGAVYASGAMPPKAENETRYTVTWTLSNSANSIIQAQARAVLPIYVKWVGSQPGTNENVTYNESTREVIWNIGTVRANTGFDSNREVSFTVALKPSLSQVGSVPQLMKDVYLSGTDSFTGTLVKTSRGPITTLLSNDPSFKYGNERVIQ